MKFNKIYKAIFEFYFCKKELYLFYLLHFDTTPTRDLNYVLKYMSCPSKPIIVDCIIMAGSLRQVLINFGKKDQYL